MAPPPKKTKAQKPLTTVMEDYLEAIFDLDQKKKVVRVKDIAQEMDVKMPTVSSMLKTLSEKGLVNYAKYEYIELTEDGVRVGRAMRRRHEALQAFLTEILKVEPRNANEEACKMEHALSSETLNRLIDFLAFVRTSPKAGKRWLRYFQEFRSIENNPDESDP